MNEYEIWSTYQLAMVSRAIFTLFVFFAGWFAARVTLNLVNSGNANMFTKLVTTVFGVLIVYFGLIQQAFTTWTTEATAYALSQVDEPSGRFDSFIAFFASVGEPSYSLIGDPFITLFWIILGLYIILPLWVNNSSD